jgi:seryl-tRNA synthetase
MARTSENVHRLAEELRTRLANIDMCIKTLRSKVNGDAKRAEAEVRNQLAKVSADIAASKPRLAAAEAQMSQWLEAQKNAPSQKVAEWKATREFGKLQARATQAERYAAAARDVAVVALYGAHQAALEAYLAFKEASAAGRQ